MIMDDMFNKVSTTQMVCSTLRFLAHSIKPGDDDETLLYLDNVEDSMEAEESVDHLAVWTSNVLFFIVMFIFAIFET